MTPAEVVTKIFSEYIGKHEDKNNRAPWLDFIEKKANLLGAPWCALIIFWEILPRAVLALNQNSLLVPCAHVRTGAKLNANLLHADPLAGDIGYLGHVGSATGHQVFVKEVFDTYYTTIEGNTSASDGTNTNGGEVASHKRLRGTHGGLEELGFATPFKPTP